MRWLADENLNNDIIRAQEAGLTGVDDERLLAWAAEQNRVLLTPDVSTITAFAYRRIMKGDRMPGVFEVSRLVPSRSAIEDILLLTACSVPDEWDGRVRYLPLR